MVDQPIRWLTGARKEEQSKVLLAFLALLCLLISYYLVKPLRNSKFLSEFDPSLLPLVYASTAFLSFSVTKIFSHLAQKVEKYRLVSGAYVAIILCKLILGNWLSTGGKAAVVCFFFFASVYFLLAVATLWACINDMFTTDQSERCFGFVALGGTIGSILGSKLSELVSRSQFRDDTLYFSIVFLVLALVLVLLAARLNREPKLAENVLVTRTGPGFWSELRALTATPYLRRIAITVMLLAVATTAVEFLSQTTIDRELARQEFESQMSSLEGLGFEEVYQLKSQSLTEQNAYLSKAASLNGLETSAMSDLYQSYRTELELETRSFFAITYYYQGLFGMFSLLVVARFLFPRVGMRYCYTLLPTFTIVGLCLFGLTVDLLLVQTVIILVGAMNYSLNNAAKEILYTATNEETLFRFKPMIEGPCMRAGDVLSSILKLAVSAAAGVWLMSRIAETHFFVIVTVLLLTAWVRCAWLAGKEYDLQRKKI